MSAPSRAGQAPSTPAGPPGRVPRLGRDSVSRLGWPPLPRLGRSAAKPRLGSPRPGWLSSGWAASPLPGWASCGRSPAGPTRCSPAGPAPSPPAGPGYVPQLGSLQQAAASSTPRLGRIRRIRPGRDSFPDRSSLAHLDRINQYAGWATLSTVPDGPGRDPWPSPDYSQGRPRYALLGRIIPLQGRYLLPPGHITRPASPPAHRASPGTPPGSDWHIFHRHVLVLGRPLAQTSISLLS
jgi:hypothetical protein